MHRAYAALFFFSTQRKTKVSIKICMYVAPNFDRLVLNSYRCPTGTLNTTVLYKHLRKAYVQNSNKK